MKHHFITIVSILSGVVSLGLSDDLEPQLLEKTIEIINIDHSDVEAAKKQWKPYNGSWTVIDGVMRAKTIGRTNGIANAAILVDCRNKIFQFRVRMLDDAEFFHVGFTPDREELDKDGHLFSLVVSKSKATIIKHADKRPEKKDREKELDSKSVRIKTDKWLVVMLERKDTKTVVQIKEEGGRKIYVLEAEHPTFKVNSPFVVFRCFGESIEFDDVRIWRGK